MRSRLGVALRRGVRRRGTADPGVACRAPFTSMYLDQRGDVRACCMNDFHVLGNVTERSLTDIWHGEEARSLRRAMEVHDLGLGCDFCQWQVDEGRPDLAFSRWFTEFPVSGPEPEWPRQLELSISNTCNLQCVMCNGEWSSSIRSQREGLPPLPRVYGDAFFEDLAGFLPHLDRIKFLGGEPFLAAETLRVLEMLVDLGLSTPCHVTTNGSQWTPRVERILDLVPVDVAVSVDAATGPTYEAIRQGASWDVLRRNLDRLRDHADRRGTSITMTYCLMVPNWHEFEDFCRWADELGLGCAVNTVTQPDPLSLFHLPPDDLAPIVAALTAPGAGQGLGNSRTIWEAEVDKLVRHLDLRRSGARVTGIDVRRADEGVTRSGFDDDEPALTPRRRRTTSWLEADVGAETLLERHVGPQAPRFDLDESGRVVRVPDHAEVLGIEASRFLGLDTAEIESMIATSIAPIAAIEHQRHAGDVEVVVALLGDGQRVHVVAMPPLDGSHPAGRWLYFAWGEAIDALS